MKIPTFHIETIYLHDFNTPVANLYHGMDATYIYWNLFAL